MSPLIAGFVLEQAGFHADGEAKWMLNGAPQTARVWFGRSVMSGTGLGPPPYLSDSLFDKDSCRWEGIVSSTGYVIFSRRDFPTWHATLVLTERNYTGLKSQETTRFQNMIRVWVHE
ncbi:hypothetical protein MKZ38_004911 [Zalerion maritima]|uniref:Uncharacterized protein n=1 Tax=Zalerion maritima TaxID=339359 RepID=A0AAD5RYB0_9PEZI|nr:hypothetical protein MKZ38_004911 [Zalerion maritima]